MNTKLKMKIILRIIYLIFYLICCFTLSYGLSGYLFKATGQPSPFVSYLVATVLGIGIFGVAGRFGAEMISRRKYGMSHKHMRSYFLESTIEALNKIARGDFNVSIITQENDPFSQVADSVNKMARELSSMEIQRQDFISNVSHEIQSPLTSISGFAALLKSDSLSKQQRDHYIEIIEIESKRLSKLSDNLMKLSMLETENAPLSPSDFRLDKQLEHDILMLEPHWKDKNISVEAEFEKLNVHADEDLLNQVWVNLLHNAVKFTPENGKIVLSLYTKDNKIQCRISDNGIGIAKEDQIHIFERFYKVDKSRDRSIGGNGLGLSLCKKIIELHGGQITLESELGKGTTFLITL